MGVEEQKQQWREKAQGMRFFGQPVIDLDRDGLLAVVGCLQASAETERQLRASERETWAGISNVKDK